MAPNMLRKTIQAVKDQTSIGLAKVKHPTTLLSDLAVAIVKATKHDEYPPKEIHIDIILNLTCYSRPYVCSCVKSISRRLRRTNNWVVALKTLMLIHRLLQDGDPTFEYEFFFATRRGSCLLNMTDFIDRSCQDSWEYSIFVRKYAMYLNDQLRHKMHAKKGKHGSNVSTSWGERKERVKRGAIVVRAAARVQEMNMEDIFIRIHSLMKTLELFLNCRPTGSCKTNRLVMVALHSLIKESFILYYNITEIMDVLMKRFMELDIRESLIVHEILFRTSKQFDELHAFYNWSISIGIARCSEYPEVVKIPERKLNVMEAYIREKTMNEPEPEPPVEEKKMISIKALPQLERIPEKTQDTEVKIYEVGDLINLEDDDSPKTEEHPDKLALALFNDDAPKTCPAMELSSWETFNDSDDWETALEQSANKLTNQKDTPSWGFVSMMPDYTIYHQGAVNQKPEKASSIGVPAMLALPAPPAQNAAANLNMGYPYYAAPFEITPPAYVQMSDIDKKQTLPKQEQVMWQQYARDGMQGPVTAYAMIQPHPFMYNQGGYMYNPGGYTTSY